MIKELKLKYFDKSEKVECPFCKKVITIPRVRDLVPFSEEDRDPTTDIIIVSE